jgi:hypothetical protein
LIVTDEELDLSMREADVAIRTWQPTQPDLIQRKLFSIGLHAYSPEYIKRFGTPRARRSRPHHHHAERSPGQAHLQNRNWLIEAGRNGSGPRRPTSRSTTSWPGPRLPAGPRYRGATGLLGRGQQPPGACSVNPIRCRSTPTVYPEELKTVAGAGVRISWPCGAALAVITGDGLH